MKNPTPNKGVKALAVVIEAYDEAAFITDLDAALESWNTHADAHLPVKFGARERDAFIDGYLHARGWFFVDGKYVGRLKK